MGSKPLPRFNVSENINLVLGGGLVKDSLVVLGGEPGVGKSTLILEIIKALASSNTKILYASGEENVDQIRDRARRLKVTGGPGVFLLNETDVEAVLDEARDSGAQILILDSLQTMRSREMDSVAGSPYQMKEVTSILMEFAKSERVACILVGHVTKEGDIAGPKVVEHRVDAVLSLEAVENTPFRVLQASKNRFGSTLLRGHFEMTAEGIREISQKELDMIESKDDGRS
jgi:DNA repair protein RadA/Sms